MEVQRYAREARDVILIGHAGPSGGRRHDGAVRCLLRRAHPPGRERRRRREARGARSGSASRSSRRPRCRSTTPRRSSTRCASAFPTLATPRKEDICYATQNRQDAVKKLLEQCDVLLVVGSRTSSNSNRLRELADRAGVPGYLVDGPDDLQPRVVRRQERRRRHRRRIGAGAAGAAGGRAAARWGGEAPSNVRRARRERASSRCRASCASAAPEPALP